MSRLFNDAASEYLLNNQAVLAGHPLVMACRFNTNDESINQTAMGLFDKDDANMYFAIEIRSDNAIWAHSVDNVSGSAKAISQTGYTENQWHHACGLFPSSTDRRVLLDGGSKGTDVNDRTPANLDRTAIGRRNSSGPGFYMSGLIAETAVWDLSDWPGATAADKADNFEKIVPSLVKGFSPLHFPLGLVAYWPFVRGLNDKVGGYNLTASGTAIAAHPKIIYPFGPRLEQHSKIIPLSGSIAIQSGMTGVLKVSRKLSGAVDIQSEVTGILEVSRKLSGTIAIQSGVSGILTVQKENVRWSAGLFTFRGTSYEIAAGESNKKFIYWDPNYTTMFRATNDLQDVLNCDGWIMCIGESGVASPVFARKLIHGGIIQAGTITAEFAQIADAAITTAKIADLAVETLKIKDEAVTLMVAAFTAAQVQRNDTNWYTVQTITMTTTGAPVMLIAAVQWKNVGDNGCNIRVRRDGSVNVYATNLYSIGQLGNPFCVAIVDEPDSGEHDYDLDMQTTAVGVGDPRLWYKNRSLVGKEVKK